MAVLASLLQDRQHFLVESDGAGICGRRDRINTRGDGKNHSKSDRAHEPPRRGLYITKSPAAAMDPKDRPRRLELRRARRSRVLALLFVVFVQKIERRLV